MDIFIVNNKYGAQLCYVGDTFFKNVFSFFVLLKLFNNTDMHTKICIR